jgi:hypothetical protein
MPIRLIPNPKYGGPPLYQARVWIDRLSSSPGAGTWQRGPARSTPEEAERDVATLGKLCENERLYDVMGFVMRGWQGSGPGPDVDQEKIQQMQEDLKAMRKKHVAAYRKRVENDPNLMSPRSPLEPIRMGGRQRPGPSV